MVEMYTGKKIFVFLVIGLFLAANILPTINGLEITRIKNDADYIRIDVATQIAYATLDELHKNSFSIAKSVVQMNNMGDPLFYVFDLTPQGYLVVSASYDLPPVIAYSFSCDFKYGTPKNPLCEMLIADITARLGNLEKLPIRIVQERHLQWDSYIQNNVVASGNFEQWPPEGTTSTGGWLETKWTQEKPYNNLCPLDKTDGKRSLAGCPSIAMAMILNYYKTTNDVMFNDSDDYHHIYDGNNYWIDNDYVSYDFPSFPTLNSYLEALSSHYQNQTPTTETDIAALIFACGVAAKQVYGSDGSGTFSVNQALAAYKKFQCTTCTLLHDTDSDVYNRLSKNMIDGLPAHLAVVNNEWTSGHNLVVDGYNTKDFYHLNFGWGGSFNGWYLLPDDIPYGLTVLEGVIVDIMYNHSGSQMQCTGSIHLTNIVPNATILENFTIENSGSPGSLLNWEITNYPEWGSWIFSLSKGTNLTPEQGPITINVSIGAPEKKNRDYTGFIKVTNLDNPADCHIVLVTLTTSYKPDSRFVKILQILMEHFSYAFPLIRQVREY